MFHRFEPVTNCHQLLLLFRCQLKREFCWESVVVAPDLPVQIFGFDPVKFCQIAVDHYFVPADNEYPLFDPLDRYQMFRHSSPLFVLVKRGNLNSTDNYRGDDLLLL